MQKLILHPKTTTTAIQTPKSQRLTFNIPDVDELLPTLKEGDFAIIYGSQNVTSLLSQLCVRAHLPKKQGGLESKTIFIDAANSSSLSDISHIAELQQLEPQKIQEQIQPFRAYTAYKLLSLLIDELEQIIKTTDAKLVAISDIMNPFITESVDTQEARLAYSQIMNRLSNFAKKHSIIIVVTNLPHENNTKTKMLQEITDAKASILLKLTKTSYTSEIELEKHPSYMLGIMDFRPEIKTITDFFS